METRRVRAAEWAIRFLLGAALAAGRVPGGGEPFGAAFVGAAGAGPGGLAALLGAVFGYLFCRGAEEGLRYGAACVLIFAVAFAFYDVGVYKRGWFMPITAGMMNAVSGLVVLSGPFRVGALAGVLGEALLTAGAAWLFREGASPVPSRRQKAGVLALAGAALISLGELELLGLSIGRMGAVFGVLAAALLGGPGLGAAAGIALGLAMDLSAGGAAFYGPVYSLMGLGAGLLRGRGKALCALTGVAAPALLLLWSEAGGPLHAVWEGTAGAVLFLAAPRGLLERMAGYFRGEDPREAERGAVRAAAERLRTTAAAFEKLFGALKGAFQRPDRLGKSEDPGVIFDRTADRVCAKCPLRERCWQGGYNETWDNLNAALPSMLETGRAAAEMFPQRFRDRCARFPMFLKAAGEELYAHLTRRQYQDKVGENRLAVCRQYGDVAQVLEETAQAMAAMAAGAVRAPAEPLTATAGVAGMKKAGMTVSGDAAGWFKEGSALYVMLCDGMGSGPQARRESDLALELLEKFLRAGVRPQLALRTLSQGLALRGEETGGFSTVDLLVMDLTEAKGQIYKLGAAPSYLKRGGCVTRIVGDSLPAGACLGESREPDRAEFRLDPGDCVVMLTDGVTAEGEDEWVKSALSAFESASPRALAEELVGHLPGQEDDKTAVVVRVGLKGEA